MIKLGQKIKKLRNEKGLSQANLVMDGLNNSLISHIEIGTTKNPNESTLIHIANILDISFKELVKDTDYQPEPIASRGTGIAISQTDFTVKLEKDHSFIIKRRIYPRYDDNGNENLYCPKMGTPLLTGCKNCKKPINSPDSIYCMGCGYLLFFDFHKELIEGEYEDNFKKIWTDEEERNNFIKYPSYIWLNDFFHEEMWDLFNYPNDTSFSDNDILSYIKDLYNNPERFENNIAGSDKWTVNDFRAGILSSVPEIVEEHVIWKAKKTFAIEYMQELKKLNQNEIID